MPEPEPLPGLASLGVFAPAYVRVMSKQAWGKPEDGSTRLRAAVECFLKDKSRPDYSFYFVQSDDDLRLAVLAHDATRKSPLEQLDAVAFLEAEVQGIDGISVMKTPGTFDCNHAKEMHRDLQMDQAAVEKLCQTAMDADRSAFRFRRVALQGIQEFACDGGCHTVKAARESGMPCQLPQCAETQRPA